MFQILIGVQLLILVFVLIFALVKIENYNTKIYSILLFLLCFSQMFTYYPGVDVSPYAYSHNLSSPFKVGITTLSGIVTTVFLLVAVRHIIFSKIAIYVNDLITLLCVFIVNIVASVLMWDISNINSFVKQLLPICMYFVLEYKHNKEDIRRYEKCIIYIQCFLIIQVLVCKVLTGNYSAHNYYYELKNEYFGYLNHPHLFAGLLCILIYFNIYNIYNKRKEKTNLVLLSISLVLVYLSGVRSYMVSLAISIVFITLLSLYKDDLKKFRKISMFLFLILCLMMPASINYYQRVRRVSSISSGRVTRWIYDIKYIFNQNIFNILFGGGYGKIELINRSLLKYKIGSLNFLVDNLADFGIIGSIIILVAVLRCLIGNSKKSISGFRLGLVLMFLLSNLLTSCMDHTIIIIVVIIISHMIKSEE